MVYNTVSGALNNFLSRHLPEQRVYLRTDKSTRFFRISPLSQAIVGTIIVAAFSWTIIASATLVINNISAKSEKAQLAILQDAYQTRLEQISAERDKRAVEAKAAQDRFYVALNQISYQQERLLEAEEERRELATGIKLMQRKLQAAVKDRDLAQETSDQILAELQTATGDMTDRLKKNEDVIAAFDFLTEALDNTAQSRDAIVEEKHDLVAQLEQMELDARLLRQRSDQVFARLEDAVDVTLSPLSRALNRSGINTDALLDEVRRSYSGQGGPITPLQITPESFYADHISDRASLLLDDLDRLNLMKLAAQRVPLGHPVAGGYRYTSGFGYRRDPVNGGRRLHNGADMAGPLGTDIIATGDGVVTFAGTQSGYGRIVKIRHSQGFETLYAHLWKIHVKSGQKVSRGDHIGDMGNSGRSTGVHLHYEIRIGGKPVNPRNYMKAANDVF